MQHNVYCVALEGHWDFKLNSGRADYFKHWFQEVSRNWGVTGYAARYRVKQEGAIVAEIPAIVRAYRKQNEGVSDAEGANRYFDCLEKLRSGKRDARSRLQHAMMCLSFLEPFIKDAKKEFGEVPPVIPAISEATIFQAINGARGQLENILELVKFFPEIHDYIPGVEKGFVMLELAAKIRKHLSKSPGALQDKLKKPLGFNDGRLISGVVHYMELAGQLERKKSGKTYELYIREAKKAPFAQPPKPPRPS